MVEWRFFVMCSVFCSYFVSGCVRVWERCYYCDYEVQVGTKFLDTKIGCGNFTPNGFIGNVRCHVLLELRADGTEILGIIAVQTLKETQATMFWKKTEIKYTVTQTC